jgi:hypothetical protein
MATNSPAKAEPVPTASQFVVLPFLSALEGYLRAGRETPDFRMTIHRTMVRGDEQYLQQVTNYVGGYTGGGVGGVGRINHTQTGIIGAAYHSGKTHRTKLYADEPSLLKDIAADMKDAGQEGPPTSVAKSYVAIPFTGAKGRTVLVLYADSPVLNRFADNVAVEGLVWMCHGFARLLKDLQTSPVGLVKNFPLVESNDSPGSPSVYKRVQEIFDYVSAPSVAPISSFNFESSAA